MLGDLSSVSFGNVEHHIHHSYLLYEVMLWTFCGESDMMEMLGLCRWKWLFSIIHHREISLSKRGELKSNSAYIRLNATATAVFHESYTVCCVPQAKENHVALWLIQVRRDWLDRKFLGQVRLRSIALRWRWFEQPNVDLVMCQSPK